MQFLTLFGSALALVSAASAGVVPQLVARQNPIGSTLKVGEGFFQGQDIGALQMINQPQDSFTVAGARVDAVNLSVSPNIFGFTSVSCSFTTKRLQNDANGNFACDLSTKIADVFSGQGLVQLPAEAGCVFCALS